MLIKMKNVFIQNAFSLVSVALTSASPEIDATNLSSTATKKESSLPSIAPKGRPKRSHILGIEVNQSNNPASEKLPLKTNDSSMFDQSTDKDCRSKNLFSPPILESPTFDSEPRLVQGSVSNDGRHPAELTHDRKKKEKIISLDELDDTPVEKVPEIEKEKPQGKETESPQFQFRSVRSSGNLLVFNKAASKDDPVVVFSKLVGQAKPGRSLQIDCPRDLAAFIRCL